MDAVRFDRESRPSAELIGQGVLDEAPAIPRAPLLQREVRRSRRRFPSSRRRSRATRSRPARASERSDGRLSVPRLRISRRWSSVHARPSPEPGPKLDQHDARRPIEGYGSIVFRLSREFRLKQVVKRDAVPGRSARQQSLSARKSHQAIAEAGLELLKRLASTAGPVDERHHHADEIAGAVLKLAQP